MVAAVVVVVVRDSDVILRIVVSSVVAVFDTFERTKIR